jgi:hypothetical protein
MMRRLSRRDTAVALSGLLVGGAIAAGVAASLWPADHKPAPTAATASTDPLEIPLRDREIALPAHTYQSGEVSLVPLRMTCGLSEVVGTHAEWFAQGQYCRIRVVITGDDGFTHTFDPGKTTMTTTAGAAIDPDIAQAQQIKRQPDRLITVYAHTRLEFDIYYDVPRTATINGFTFSDAEGGPVVKVPLPVRSWPFA